MTAAAEDVAYHLPKLRVSFGFENDTHLLNTDDNVAEFFDVKFCPYQPLDQNPVFAAVSKKHIVVCKLSSRVEDVNPCSVLTIIRDNDEGASNCCCTWTKDSAIGVPYICAGGADAKVKVYDVIDGRLVECLTGHGGDINDLATSPTNPSIIASASNDTSIRLWSIDSKFKSQPCLCIFAGEGHYWNLLSISFHDTGRYLLSGGHDQVINLWTIPDLPTEPTATPLQVHYPHFSSSAVHSGIIDCVTFYGDLVLSRACHDNVIVLWRIEGFSSSGTPPPLSAAATPQAVVPTSVHGQSRLTRSYFWPAATPDCPSQYTRLVEFQTPNCGPQFFMRFSLHHVPGQNPVLAFCNAGGNILFWDLRRLITYHDVVRTMHDPRRDPAQPTPLPSWLKPIIPRQRADMFGRVREKQKRVVTLSSVKTRVSLTANTTRAGTVDSTADGAENSQELTQETLNSWASRYDVGDPHVPIKAHKSESSPASFVGRQVAWSPSGEWCVVVGSSNTALVLQRWAK